MRKWKTLKLAADRYNWVLSDGDEVIGYYSTALAAARGAYEYAIRKNWKATDLASALRRLESRHEDFLAWLDAQAAPPEPRRPTPSGRAGAGRGRAK